MFEDNDPSKRLLAVAELQQRPRRVLGILGQGIDPVDLSNEAYKFGVNYFHLWIDSLTGWQGWQAQLLSVCETANLSLNS